MQHCVIGADDHCFRRQDTDRGLDGGGFAEGPPLARCILGAWLICAGQRDTYGRLGQPAAMFCFGFQRGPAR
jgi:hypothetical protein